MYFLSKPIIKETFSYSQWYSYSSVCKFVIGGTDENGENWDMTNDNQFTVSDRNVIDDKLLLIK